MLNITVLCVGKLKEAYWRDACAEYQKRLGAYCRLSVIEVEECRAPDAPSPAQLAAVIEEEGRRLLAKIPTGAAVVPLCIEGESVTSEGLTDKIERLTVGGVSHLVFVIGGSWGLSEAVKRAGRWRLSFSPLTFPHQLARVLLLEQLYRCMQIRTGGKYHK